MQYSNDAIAALATPPGVSGLAVVRVSGENAFETASSCFYGKLNLKDAKSHTIHYGNFIYDDILVDKVTASVFKSPHSFTGENIIEFGCHGGMTVARQILKALIENGARIAEPGEFTKRAFINGKLDLSQVEAAADLIHSISVPGAQTAARQLNGNFTFRIQELRKKLLDTASLLELELDFSEEDIEFVESSRIIKEINEIIEFCHNLKNSFHSAEILREGFYIAIVGYPNSGKSTLFNTLLNRQRAIVSEIPGTTRDYLEEKIIVKDIPVRIIDTAGIRDAQDIIEIQGIRLVESVLQQADMILILNDMKLGAEHSQELIDDIKSKYIDRKTILIQNKIDLLSINPLSNDNIIYISAKRNEGIDILRNVLANEAEKSIERNKDVLINQRHSILLEKAENILNQSIVNIKQKKDNVLIAYDIRTAAGALGEITGETWNEDVLNNIFSRFCIGK